MDPQSKVVASKQPAETEDTQQRNMTADADAGRRLSFAASAAADQCLFTLFLFLLCTCCTNLEIQKNQRNYCFLFTTGSIDYNRFISKK